MHTWICLHTAWNHSKRSLYLSSCITSIVSTCHVTQYIYLLLVVSEAPTNFSLLDVTNTSVRLSWDPPNDSNGIISNYTVLLFLSFASTSSDSVVLPGSVNEHTFDQLNPYVNYTAVVFVNTSFGAGNESSLYFMTEIGSELSSSRWVLVSIELA